MRITPLILFVPLVGLMGCGSSPRVEREVELATLREAAVAYYAAASAKDRDAVVSFYDTDAVLVPPGAEPVEGPEEIGAYRFGFIETEGISLEFEILKAEVSASGDMGWTLANGDITIDRGAEPPGRDLVRDYHMWHKQTDGSWKVIVDFWNSGPVADN
jgi:ketosteroid isomerase-like protein